MDSTANILQFCRLCLVKDGVNIPIFDEQGDVRQIYLKISSCLPVKVAREDHLPKKICDGCSNKLDNFYDFWRTSAESEKQLLAWLGATGKDAAPVNVKEEENFDEPLASDISKNDDDENKCYMFEQKVEEGPPVEINDEPPSKRPRRTAAVKAAIAMDQNSDDDGDSGEPITKMEDDSDETDGDDREPAFVDVPSTSADDQPGPSGVSKDGSDAPCAVCAVCLGKYEPDKFSHHEDDLPNTIYCRMCVGFFTLHHPCRNVNKRCAFCGRFPKQGIHHKCFLKYSELDLDYIIMRHHCKSCNRRLVNGACEYCKSRHTRPKKKNERTAEYNCKPCKMTFSSQSKYKSHRMVYHRRHHICPKCGKEVVHLAQHIRGVHGERDLQCELCDKTFSHRKHLSRHQLVHTNVYNYQCDMCDKRYKTPFSLKVHKRTHDEVKPFQCAVCLKTFTTKQWRDNHQRTHK